MTKTPLGANLTVATQPRNGWLDIDPERVFVSLTPVRCWTPTGQAELTESQSFLTRILDTVIQRDIYLDSDQTLTCYISNQDSSRNDWGLFLITPDDG